MSDAYVTLTEATFDAEVLQSDLPVLVDVWAPWCGPCRIVSPVVEEIAKDYAGKLKVGKLNVDDNLEIGRKYGIQSIPTLLLFKDGKPVKGIVGAVPREAIEKVIIEFLGEG